MDGGRWADIVMVGSEYTHFPPKKYPFTAALTNNINWTNKEHWAKPAAEQVKNVVDFEKGGTAGLYKDSTIRLFIFSQEREKLVKRTLVPLFTTLLFLLFAGTAAANLVVDFDIGTIS